MTPPELAGDAPVVDVGHPLHVGLAVVVGGEGDVALLDSLDGFVRERLDLDEPLHGEAWLDDDPGALRDRDRHGMVFDLDESADGFEFGDYAFACLKAIQAMEGRIG